MNARDHLSDLDRYPAGQHQRAGAVPSVVQRARRQAARGHMVLELNCHPIRAERDTVRPAEHQAVILVVNAEELALLLLSFAVPGKRFLGGRDERHSPATLARLGRLEQAAYMNLSADRTPGLLRRHLRACDGHDRLADAQAGAVRVDVRPTHAAQLGPA
jgi:hypothetical protein